MRFFASADRHGADHDDALWVMAHPVVTVLLREDQEKLLHIGFDRVGRAREVITDTSVSTGEPVVIHADDLTPAYYEFL